VVPLVERRFFVASSPRRVAASKKSDFKEPAASAIPFVCAAILRPQQVTIRQKNNWFLAAQIYLGLVTTHAHPHSFTEGTMSKTLFRGKPPNQIFPSPT
jgi:hypothetical protein